MLGTAVDTLMRQFIETPRKNFTHSPREGMSERIGINRVANEIVFRLCIQ